MNEMRVRMEVVLDKKRRDHDASAVFLETYPTNGLYPALRSFGELSIVEQLYLEICSSTSILAHSLNVDLKCDTPR